MVKLIYIFLETCIRSVEDNNYTISNKSEKKFILKNNEQKEKFIHNFMI